MVIFSLKIREYLNDLTPLLYKYGYFSFYDSADNYVTELMTNIENNLPFKSHKPAPPYFNRYGQDLEYSSFKKSKQTTWHVFFNFYLDELGNEVYVVKYISNNHVIGKYL